MYVPPGKGCFAMRTPISPVPRVQLHVTISAPLMLEQSRTPATSVRHLITVALQLEKS